MLKIREDLIFLTYLHQSGSHFTWPQREDTSWQAKDDVFFKVHPMMTLSGSCIKPTLLTDDVTEVTRIFTLLKSRISKANLFSVLMYMTEVELTEFSFKVSRSSLKLEQRLPDMRFYSNTRTGTERLLKLI